MPAAKAQLFPCATLRVLFMESLSWCFSMQMPYGKSVCVCVGCACVWQTCIYWRGKLATVESQFATSIMQFKRARKKNRNRFKRIVCLFASHAPFARHAPLLALVAASKLFIFGKLIFRSSIFLHRTLLSRLVPHFAAHLSRTIFSFSRFSADSFACSTKQRPSQAWILANVDI